MALQMIGSLHNKSYRGQYAQIVFATLRRRSVAVTSPPDEQTLRRLKSSEDCTRSAPTGRHILTWTRCRDEGIAFSLNAATMGWWLSFGSRANVSPDRPFSFVISGRQWPPPHPSPGPFRSCSLRLTSVRCHRCIKLFVPHASEPRRARLCSRG